MMTEVSTGQSEDKPMELQEGSNEHIYYSDDSVDSTLQKLVDLLNIPDFSVSQLSVKRLIPGKIQKAHCFDFSPLEIPITERVRAEFGPGAYEVWVRTEKKEIHKRLKLNVSQDEATGAQQGARRSRGGRSRGGQQNRGGGGHHGGGNQGIQQELADIKSQMSAMQAGVQAPENAGTGITHKDLIDAEERGYKRAKEAFDIQLSSVKEHHETQLTMIKESKGTERYLDDDKEDDTEDMGGMMRDIAAIMAPAIEALSPLAEGYRTQKETESVLARVGAGLPPEPEIEDDIDPEKGKEEGGKIDESGEPAVLDQRVLEAMATLVTAAAKGEDPHQHAEGIVAAFEPAIITGLFLHPGSLDSLFGQRPDLISLRPWFERLISHMALINSEKNSSGKDEQTTSSPEKSGEKDEKNVRKK
ncbi:MAG: hypothetical protein RPU41_00650 [Candidatus Sedimenticola sp. (ex Thyasira tokunagai)]